MSTIKVYKGDTYAVIEESWLRDFEKKGWSAEPVGSKPKEETYADRVQQIVDAAHEDITAVSRDDLVAAARMLDLDPPDRGPKASKAAILRLIDGKVSGA